jgi:hypothetical protein
LITRNDTTFGVTPPDKWIACRRDLYLAMHNTYKIQTSCHWRDFFLFSVFICTSLSWMSWLLSLVYNTHNTNIHARGGIRTRNPSKRSSADSRLRPLGHWDWHIRIFYRNMFLSVCILQCFTRIVAWACKVTLR